MTNFFSLVLFFFLQFHFSSIFTTEIDRDDMRPMNIASQEYQQKGRKITDSSKTSPNEENDSLLSNRQQTQESKLTCFQKCFTTHDDLCYPSCCRINTRPVRYHGGYCGTCCEATVISSVICMPACILCLACSGALQP